MLHVLEHALIDSLKVFAFVFILYFVLTFFEKLISEYAITVSRMVKYINFEEDKKMLENFFDVLSEKIKALSEY